MNHHRTTQKDITIVTNESNNIWIDLETATPVNEYCDDCTFRFNTATYHIHTGRQQLLLTPEQAKELRDRLTDILKPREKGEK